VDEQHLNSAQGMVQCGVCGMVFNAAQHIQSTVATEAPAVIPEKVDEQEAVVIAQDIGSFDSVNSNESDEVIEDTTTLATSIRTQDIDTLIANENDPTQNSALSTIQFKKSVSRTHKFLYSFFTILLASLLIFQLSIPYRYQLASTMPSLRYFFETVCVDSICTMEPPYDVGLIELTNSNFEIDPNNKKLLRVALELQNNAKYDLQFPRLILTLLDNEGTIISKRKILPQDYVSSSHVFFQANEEFIIKLDLSINESNVSNYKIRLI
jgi:hypothetical protein